MKSLLLYCLVILTFAGCSKTELSRYDEGSDVYFSYRRGASQADSINISFALLADTVVSAGADFYVKTIGKPGKENRSYAIMLDEAHSTAIAGKHYRLPPMDSFYIKPGQVQDTIRIEAMRSADLRDTSVILYLQLVPNNHFSTSMQAYDYAASTPVSAVRLRIVIDDILRQPANWAASEAYLGKYSREKLTLMIKTLSLQMIRFYPTTGTSAYTATQLMNFARQMQAYLNTQAAGGNVILEKDGSPMVMGPSAQ